LDSNQRHSAMTLSCCASQEFITDLHFDTAIRAAALPLSY